MKTRSKQNINLSDEIKDFEFRYWNSVEHHLSQNKAKAITNGADFVDNLGNLYLISKSANSRLRDRDVKEKVQPYSNSNMGANRQIIYKITESNGFNWNHDNIHSHYNDLIDLLNKRASILN